MPYFFWIRASRAERARHSVDPQFLADAFRPMSGVPHHGQLTPTLRAVRIKRFRSIRAATEQSGEQYF